MNRTLNIIVLFAAVIGVGAILSATVPASGAKQPILTPVTVAVEGLHCQACPAALQKDLAKMSGVSSVSATLNPAQVTASLNEAKFSAGAFVAAIAKHPRMMDHAKTYGARLVVYVDAAMCAKNAQMCEACFTEIPKTLKKVSGINDVKLDATGKIVTIGFVPGAKVTTEQIAKALAGSSFKFTTSFSVPTARTAGASNSATNTGACPYQQGGGGCCGN